MDYKEMFIALVAYCQNVGVLSKGSSVYEEVASICGIDEADAAEAID